VRSQSGVEQRPLLSQTRYRNFHKQGRAMARPCGLRFRLLDFASGLPPLYAPSSAAKRGSARRVFERSELGYWGQTPISLRRLAPHPSGEPNGSANLGSDPKNPSAGCPQRSVGTQTAGAPFFCLFFGDAKKRRSPAGAKPGKPRAVGRTSRQSLAGQAHNQTHQRASRRKTRP
jgi:hypothetical protein